MILPLRRHILVPADLDGHLCGQDEARRTGMAKIRSALPLSFASTPWAKRMRRTEGGGNIFIMTKKAETRSPGRSAKRLRAASEGVNLKNVIIFFMECTTTCPTVCTTTLSKKVSSIIVFPSRGEKWISVCRAWLVYLYILVSK